MTASPPEFVSVIIPVYNGERFIADTVNAVSRQPRAPDEIVIANDGSGDAIRVISIPDGGVSNARNTGIAASRGSIIAFLDTDDLWARNKLGVQPAGLAAIREVEFICCNFNNVHADTHIVVPHLGYLKANPDLCLIRRCRSTVILSVPARTCWCAGACWTPPVPSTPATASWRLRPVAALRDVPPFPLRLAAADKQGRPPHQSDRQLRRNAAVPREDAGAPADLAADPPGSGAGARSRRGVRLPARQEN